MKSRQRHCVLAASLMLILAVLPVTKPFAFHSHGSSMQLTMKVPQSRPRIAFLHPSRKMYLFSSISDDDEFEDDEDVDVEWTDDEIEEEDDDDADDEVKIDFDERVHIEEDDEVFEEEEEEEEEEEVEEAAQILMQGQDEDYDYDYDYDYDVIDPDDDDDEEEEDRDYELEDDPDDPNYQTQKELIESSIAARDQIRADRDFNALDFLRNRLTEEGAAMLEETPFIQKVNELSKGMLLTEEDVEGIDIEKERKKASNIIDDPFPVQGDKGNPSEQDSWMPDQDLVEIDKAFRDMRQLGREEPWDKVTARAESDYWETLDNETVAEMDACLDEISSSSYNCTRWLLYDLDFNVTNLILAAVKHSPDAPILLEHWLPQLQTYKRYQYVREGGFDWTWEDVENADITELEEYYAGFGYDEIPKKKPGETGIVDYEEMDEEEMKMAAFQRWMTDVYHPEMDRKDFADDGFRDEDNVFSEYYEAPDHPDLASFDIANEDYETFENVTNWDDPEDAEWANSVVQKTDYKIDHDKEFIENFRGHLVVACTGEDSDLEIAEKITLRMGEEFGKQVFVETRVMSHARPEDNVFEVWLESYEIDLLHSKRRATMNTKGWVGPAECDDKQVEHLVEEVRFLISDDARYSYRMYDEEYEGSY